MQTLALNITRTVAARDIRPGTAIIHPGAGKPVVVEEVRATLNGLVFMVRFPGSPRRRSLTIASGGYTIDVLPDSGEVDRLVHALAIVHRGDVGVDWVFSVEADPLNPEHDPYVIDVYDIGGDIGIPEEQPVPADLLPRKPATVSGATDD